MAYAFARAIASLLYDVQPRDPLTFGAAGLLPARRAARVDPAIALRCE